MVWPKTPDPIRQDLGIGQIELTVVVEVDSLVLDGLRQRDQPMARSKYPRAVYARKLHVGVGDGKVSGWKGKAEVEIESGCRNTSGFQVVQG